jgi:hypothetical protein
VWIFPSTSTGLVFFLFLVFFNIILLFYKNNNYCPSEQTPIFFKFCVFLFGEYL